MTETNLIENRLSQHLHLRVVAEAVPGLVEARFDPRCR